MINILVPTDFSPGSAGAINTALQFASTFGGNIYLLHAFGAPYNREDVFVPVSHILQKDAEKILEAEIQKIKSQPRFGNIECEGITYMGVLNHAIKETIRDKNITIVIMGTHGASGITKEFLGSNAASVIAKSNCTFFILPYSYEFKNPEKVAILISKDILNYDLSTLAKVSEKYNPQLILLSTNDTVLADAEKAVFEKLFPGTIPGFITFEEITEVDTIAIENNADWLVMIPDNHTFMEKLFHKSLTKEIVSHAKLPLLIIN